MKRWQVIALVVLLGLTGPLIYAYWWLTNLFERIG